MDGVQGRSRPLWRLVHWRFDHLAGEITAKPFEHVLGNHGVCSFLPRTEQAAKNYWTVDRFCEGLEDNLKIS